MFKSDADNDPLYPNSTLPNFIIQLTTREKAFWLNMDIATTLWIPGVCVLFSVAAILTTFCIAKNHPTICRIPNPFHQPPREETSTSRDVELNGRGEATAARVPAPRRPDRTHQPPRKAFTSEDAASTDGPESDDSGKAPYRMRQTMRKTDTRSRG